MIIIFVGLRPEYECNMPIVLQQQSIGARPNVRDLGCFKATGIPSKLGRFRGTATAQLEAAV